VGRLPTRCGPAPGAANRNQLHSVVDPIRLIGEQSIAVALDGAPHSFYVAMLVLELALPPLMVVVAKQVADPASV
jgi:hypothetical protein